MEQPLPNNGKAESLENLHPLTMKKAWQIMKRLQAIDPETTFGWDEDPVWYMLVNGFYIHFGITNSDDDIPGAGYNAGWGAVDEGGVIVANFFPFNFTEDVWTNDLKELGRRIDMAIRALMDFVTRLEESNG